MRERNVRDIGVVAVHRSGTVIYPIWDSLYGCWYKEVKYERRPGNIVANNCNFKETAWSFVLDAFVAMEHPYFQFICIENRV